MPSSWRGPAGSATSTPRRTTGSGSPSCAWAGRSRRCPRDDYVVSTKVGRLLVPTPERAGELDDDGFVVPAATAARVGLQPRRDPAVGRREPRAARARRRRHPVPARSRRSLGRGLDDRDRRAHRAARAGGDPRDRRRHEPVRDAHRVRAALRRRRRDAGGPLHPARSVRARRPAAARAGARRRRGRGRRLQLGAARAGRGAGRRALRVPQRSAATWSRGRARSPRSARGTA